MVFRAQLSAANIGKAARRCTDFFQCLIDFFNGAIASPDAIQSVLECWYR